MAALTFASIFLTLFGFSFVDSIVGLIGFTILIGLLLLFFKTRKTPEGKAVTALYEKYYKAQRALNLAKRK